MREIQIIGAGSIGSYVAVLIGKLASAFDCAVTIFDFDRVETHNQLNQLYGPRHAGALKVNALSEILSSVGAPIIPIAQKVEDNFEPNGIVIVCVDSMEERKKIFARCAYRANVPLYIDARTGEDLALVYSLDPRNPDLVARYRGTLYSDSDAHPAPCANQRTIPTLFVVAACIGKIVALHAGDILPPSIMTETTINFEKLLESKSFVYTD